MPRCGKKPRLGPVFLDGSVGRVFAVQVSPPDGMATAGVVYIPPFAEEMNRSRRMAALQARALAADGVSVLLLDLYGTGDSDGDFADARWEIWREDVAVGIRYLQAQGCETVALWGLRAGALLAADVAEAADSVRHLILWQPVPSGESVITQMLRTRIAAAMDGSEPSVTAAALRSTLQAGESIEVAGYDLTPALVADLSTRRLETSSLGAGNRVHWVEVAAEAGRRLSPAGERAIAAWRSAGADVTASVVGGEPFWSLQEITLAPSLIEATLAAVR